MSFLKLFGLNQNSDSTNPQDALGKVAKQLDSMAPEQARLLAAFATVLVRVARTDLDVSDVETVRMQNIVKEFGALSDDDAELVVQLATEIGAKDGGTQEYLATRELKRLIEPAQRDRLLTFLFAVCAADYSISIEEEEEVRQMASELGFEHAEYTRARAAFREHREVLKGMPK
jgi:uncharacterized tellurite resistance protein B-like protein